MVVEMAAISMVTLLKSWKPTIGLRRPRLDEVTQGVEEIMCTRQFGNGYLDCMAFYRSLH